MILELIANLYKPSDRHQAAIKLAEYLNGRDFIIFIKDPVIDVYLPGPGFTQTLYGGSTWDSFLNFAAKTQYSGKLAYPDKYNIMDAIGYPGPDESIIVLLGTSVLHPELDQLNKIIPLIVALLKQEQASIAVKSLAVTAEKETRKAEKLAYQLDIMGQNLRKTLMQQQKDKAEINDLMKKKDEFMNIASHELKTPVTSMKAYLQMISQKLLPSLKDKQLSSFIEKSNKQIDKLAVLINDLLDVSKVQAGEMTYQFRMFNFSALVKDAVDEALNSTSEHKITVYCTLPPDFEVTGDRIRLEQVLNNILSNAIKYSPSSDEIIVNVGLVNNYVEVSITDFGIGISGEQLPQVFDRFFKVQNEDKRFFGLGLGLFISSEIIKAHHGEIGVNSCLGEGSKFWFKIPAK